MYSFRRSLGVLAFISLVSFGALAQSTGSSSNPPAQDQTQPQAPAATQSQQGPVTVQARIKARRDARRAQAIHDTYAHLYEVFVGGGYQRFLPGPALQRNTMYSWDAAITRYYSEKLGITFDGRGYYGTAYVGLNSTSLTRPAISHYDVLVGPVYRFRMRPKYSLAGSVKGGVAMGNFTGDTNGFGSAVLGLFPDGTTYAINASFIGEVNISPNFSLRLAPEYMATGFGSSIQADPGFTYGFVYRFGKQ
ncbi:MAG: hypothetical protein WA354_23705 [Terracidiphilus sp.]